VRQDVNVRLDSAQAEPRLVEQGNLRIRLEDGPEAAFLFLSGELDLATAELLESTIRAAEGRGAKLIVLDLSDLDFIDLNGLMVLMRASIRLSDAHRLALLHGPEHVQRLFRLTGMDRYLPFVN
jgi:anti-sigma B factor antagonist